MEKKHFAPGDPVLIENIVRHLKARGIFDQFRHDSLADVDTKPSYQNLSQRVDGFVSKFLASETWNPDQNKNELRNKLRRQIDESGMLALGVDHVVEQVINPKVFQVFAPKIREVIEQYLGLREIPEENESKQKKQEGNTAETGVKTEKLNLDSSDNTVKVEKSVISDPISEILALSDPSKQKKIIGSTTSTQVRVPGNVPLPDVSVKPDKKKDDEKPKFSVEVKAETQNQSTESSVDSHDSISQVEKETIAIKKEVIKSAEYEVSSDGFKKSSKVSDQKSESRSSFEDPKFQDFFSEDSSSQSGTNKSSDAADIKSDSSARMKSSDSDRLKTKIKHSSSQKEGSHKAGHTPSEIRKSKPKESAETASPVKPLVEKSSKGQSKMLKSHHKEHTPTKSHSSQHKSSNKQKEIDSKSGAAIKSSDSSHRKTSSSKAVSAKREGDDSKSRNIDEKSKTVEKSEQKKYSYTSSHSKVKINSPISSSYDSSQGSDQERESYSKKHLKERRKLFSKTFKVESEVIDKMGDKYSSYKSSTKIDVSEKSDDKSMKGKHKPFAIHQTSKIESRSDSTKSSSSVGSTSDSSKELSYQSTASDAVDETSSGKSDAEKKTSSHPKKAACKDVSNIHHPPPPPPPAGTSTGQTASSSLESESLESDDKQSSDENSSDSSSSENNSDDSSSRQHSAKQSSNTSDSSSGENKVNKEQPNDNVSDALFDSSSSDDDFSYFSTPEKHSREEICESDVTVSSVHTSDLSSYEDECCDSSPDLQSSSNENEKYLIKANVEKSNQVNLKKRRRNGEKESPSSDEKCNNHVSSLNTTPQKSACSDEELPSPSEPKRESRRERKLNPKYASEEYASIFNSSKKLKSMNPISEVANTSDDAQIKKKSNVILVEEMDREFEIDEKFDVNKNVFSKKSCNPDVLSKGNNTLSPSTTLDLDSDDKKVNHDSKESSSSDASSDSEAECNYTITLKIKKSPKKHNNTLTSKLNDSSYSAMSKDGASMNSLTNIKLKKVPPNVPFVENMPNENKPDNNGSKKDSPDETGITRNRKRLHHQSGDDCFTDNLKRRKTESYHEEQINNNVDALKKSDISKGKANSQVRFH